MSSLFSPPPITESSFVLPATNETITVSASSYYSANLEAPFRAVFGPESSENEAANSNQWTTGTPSYSPEGGHFIGTYACCGTVVDDQSVHGEWLQVQSSRPRVVTALSIMCNHLNPLRAPAAFVLAGSSDGVQWTSLCSEEAVGEWAPKQIKTFHVRRSLQVTHLRLIVCRTAGSEGWLTIDKVKFHEDAA